MRRCQHCRAPFQPIARHHRLCWECWRTRRDEHDRAGAYDEGWRDGYRAGARCSSSPAFEPALLADAIRLTHPDRHPPDRVSMANRVTAALNGLRDQLRSAA
jgi:hypothetical protein